MSNSLRDRNRLRVRREIQDAAWRLFEERGYGEVTTEDIAKAAGVSPSTLFRHVQNKEALLLGPLKASSARIVAAFRDRPTEESVGKALATAIRERSAADEEAEIGQWKAAMLTAPELAGRVDLIEDADRAALIEIAGMRMGLSPDDVRPAAIVHVLLSAAEFAYTRWLTSSSIGSLEESVSSVLAVVLSETWR